MSRRSLTLDERFILELYKMTQTQEKGFLVPASDISKKLKISDDKMRNILKSLCQANFVLKKGIQITLSERGTHLADNLYKESTGT